MSVADYCDWNLRRAQMLTEFSERVIRPAMERFAELPPDEQAQVLRDSGLRLVWTVGPRRGIPVAPV